MALGKRWRLNLRVLLTIAAACIVWSSGYLMGLHCRPQWHLSVDVHEAPDHSGLEAPILIRPYNGPGK